MTIASNEMSADRPGKTPRSWSGYVQMVRAPNLITAIADVLAGFMFAGGKPEEWFVLARLAVASVCLYAGGVTLNDICDAGQDTLERPHRPIPSGRISHGRALYFAFFLFMLGLALACSVSRQALLVALAIISCVVFYNLLKPTYLAPPMMGLCRALNLLFGMHGLESLVPLPAWRPMGAMALYIASVTCFARREAHGGSHWRLGLGLAGILASFYGLWQLRWFAASARFGEYRWLVLGMAATAIVLGVRALASPTPQRIQRTVKYFVLGIVLVDACIAWVTAGPTAGLAVAALLGPCILVARTYRVT